MSMTHKKRKSPYPINTYVQSSDEHYENFVGVVTGISVNTLGEVINEVKVIKRVEERSYSGVMQDLGWEPVEGTNKTFWTRTCLIHQSSLVELEKQAI